MGMTNFLADGILDHIFRGDVAETSFEQPSAIFAALHTDDPGVFGTEYEVHSAPYARQPVEFSAPSDGILSSSIDVVFTMPIATVTHYSLWTSGVGGECLYYDTVGPYTFNTNETLTITAGGISIRRIGP